MADIADHFMFNSKKLIDSSHESTTNCRLNPFILMKVHPTSKGIDYMKKIAVLLLGLWIVWSLQSPTLAAEPTVKSMTPWYDGYFALNRDGTLDRYTFTSIHQPLKRERLPYSNIRQVDRNASSFHLLQGDRLLDMKVDPFEPQGKVLPAMDVIKVASSPLYKVTLHQDRTIKIYSDFTKEWIDLSMTDVSDIAISMLDLFVVRTDGTLWSIELPRWSPDTELRFQKESVDHVKTVHFVGKSIWLIKRDGTLWSKWATYPGVNKTSPTNTFVHASSLKEVVSITGGSNRVLALTSDGSVWQWGEAKEQITRIPERLRLPPIQQIAATNDMTFAITKNNNRLHWMSSLTPYYDEQKETLVFPHLPTTLYSPQFMSGSMSSEGRMHVSTSRNDTYVVDLYGNKLFDTPGVCSGQYSAYQFGLLNVCTYKDNEFYASMIDRNGKTVIPPRYAGLDFASSSLITFKLRQNRRWGLMDRAQRVRFEASSSIPIWFGKERVALVKSGSRFGYINQNGKWIVRPTYENAYPFGNGHAFAKVKDKLGILNERGQWVVSPRYDYIVTDDYGSPSFKNGLAVVSLNGTVRIIDTKGRELKASVNLNKQKYQIAGPYQNGRILVHKNGKFGFADGSGKMIISPRYDLASDFSQYRAKVMIKSKGKERWHMINLQGRTVGNTGYAYIGEIQSAATPFEDATGKWGYLGLNGKPFVPAMYQYTLPLSEGVGMTVFEDRIGYLKIR